MQINFKLFDKHDPSATVKKKLPNHSDDQNTKTQSKLNWKIALAAAGTILALAFYCASQTSSELPPPPSPSPSPSPTPPPSPSPSFQRQPILNAELFEEWSNLKGITLTTNNQTFGIQEDCITSWICEEPLDSVSRCQHITDLPTKGYCEEDKYVFSRCISLNQGPSVLGREGCKAESVMVSREDFKKIEKMIEEKKDK